MTRCNWKVRWAPRSIWLTASFIAASGAVAHAEDRIEAFRAPFHVGQTVMACGKVAQVRSQPKVVYLNLDRDYPEQTLALVIWSSDWAAFETRFGKLPGLAGKPVCARGEVEMYRNNLQMKINNPQFLRLMTAK